MIQIKKKYDVVIIGSGISGLICGSYLARAGMKVILVEQHDKPGGYFTSFKRKGLLFDAAAHSFGNYREGGRVRNILTELGADKLLSVKRYDPSDIIITPEFKIFFWNDVKRTVRDLSKIFPDEKNNLIKFFNFFTDTDQSAFTNFKTKTFKFFLHTFFKNEILMSLLALPVLGNGGLPPSTMNAFSGAKIFAESIIDGGYYPAGGIQSLPDILDHIIKQNGGTILYGKSVKQIIVNNNAVSGVILDNNELVTSKSVVSACDMRQTFETLLGKKVAGDQVLKNLNKLIPSISSFILYIGIDEKFEGLPDPGINMWHVSCFDLDKIYNEIQKCNFHERSMFVSRVAPMGNVITTFTLAPFKTTKYWRANKKKVIEIFLDNIEKHIPNIKNFIIYRDAATPATLHGYTSNYRGAAFGWAKTSSQIFDPIMSKTSIISGLFLTGHWTGISFGMPGACSSGYDTALRIMRKEKIIN